MTRERRAQILTVAILGGALGVAGYRQASRPLPQPATPQDAIYAMLDAGRDGTVAEYIASHTGQMAASLRATLAEQGEAAFAKHLRESNAPVKAVTLQQPQSLADRQAKVKVEFVFADRNEVQWMHLEREGATWRISRVESAERIKTLVPYGTPVR